MSALILQNNLMIRVDDSDAENHANYLQWLEEARGAGVPYVEQAARAPSSRPARLVSLYYRTFTTKDSALAIACPSAGLRRRLLAVLGLEDPSLDPNVSEAERHAHDGELQEQFESRFASETTEHWEKLLRENGIPASRVRFPTELIDNEQAAANDLFIHAVNPEAGPFTVLGRALKLDEGGFVPAPFPAPFRSETRDILDWAGFTEDAIEDAIAAGAVAADPPVSA